MAALIDDHLFIQNTEHTPNTPNNTLLTEHNQNANHYPITLGIPHSSMY